MIKPLLRVEKTEKETKKGQRKAKLASLAEKKKSGKLTLEDIYEQGQIIIDMLQGRE